MAVKKTPSSPNFAVSGNQIDRQLAPLCRQWSFAELCMQPTSLGPA